MNWSDFLKALPIIIIKYEGTILLLSAVVSLLPALMARALLRRSRLLQENDWAQPFIRAFYLLAARHFFVFLYWLLGARFNALPYNIEYLPQAVIAITSSLSNYYFFRVGYALTEQMKVAVNKFLNQFHFKQSSARYVALLFFFSVSFVQLIGALSGATLGLWWTRIPDSILSILLLLFVGSALYSNVSSRRDRGVAWLSLASAIVYAALYVSYAFHPWIAAQGLANWIEGAPEERVKTMDLMVFSIAILCKFGLFFPGYVLMLMTTSPTTIRQLFEKVTDGTAEFLDNEGVVRSVQEQLHASRVELYIKLPGTQRDKIICYSYPTWEKNATNGPEELKFDSRTDYGYVMRSGEDLLFRLTNYPDNVPHGYARSLAANSSVIAVPVRFQRAVIGCLKTELDSGKFTEADMQNMQRFAAVLCLEAQDYRETDALNEISHRLTRLQIEATEYQLQVAIEEIAKINHDILAPLATGISIEAGFRCYTASVAKDDDYRAKIERQLGKPFMGATAINSDHTLRLLNKALKVTSKDLEGEDGQEGEQFFGKLILGIHNVSEYPVPLTLATNFFHRRVVSNLITDALLGFIRGSLNEVTRRLGVRLSGLGEAGIPTTKGEATREASVATWFQVLDETAREADLLWAVATQPDDEELLGEEADLVRKLEHYGRWEEKELHREYAIIQGLYLCTLKPLQKETSHVIKIVLRETGQTIWLGVGNAAFDKEIDYLSPWKGFILRFGEIADTGLHQILSRQRQEALEKDAADMHSLATSAITTGTVLHQIVNLVRGLTGPLTALEEAIRFGRLRGNENHKEMILSLGATADQIEGLTNLFTGVVKPDARRPCSLNEAIQHARYLLRDSFARFNIKVDSEIRPAHLVDVPFYIVAFALANLLNNAKDAIRDAEVKDGLIRVTVEETEKMLLCHITDNGPGVPPHLIPQLFKSGAQSDKAHGSGLGLYLSARSMRESRGDIKLTHPGPEPLTTFTLYFPKPREV